MISSHYAPSPLNVTSLLAGATIGVPHSGQRSLLARRSYPQTEHWPAGGRCHHLYSHKAGKSPVSRTRNQYLPADDEVRLLHSRYPAVKKDLLKCIVKAAGDLRQAHANEELTTVLTTRRLLALCARLERGNELPRALQVCVLNKVPQEDSRVIRETFEHHLGPLGQAVL
jgi:hypothetical protein